MSIKQAIEALEELVEYAEEAGFDWSLDNARAALAALRSMPQGEPSDAKDAARYRQLVAMKDKATPETIAHYVRNPAHLDRVIEVMEQKP